MTGFSMAPIDCAAFEDRLAGWLEGEGTDAERDRMQAHVEQCPACAALVRDLDAIVHEAQALPTIEPPAALWTAIEARLAPRGVTPLAPRIAAADRAAAADGANAASAGESSPGASSRSTPVVRHVISPRILAAAALLLVTVSAGVTWTIADRVRPAADAAPDAAPTMVASDAARTPDAPTTADASGTADADADADADARRADDDAANRGSARPADRADRTDAPMRVATAVPRRTEAPASAPGRASPAFTTASNDERTTRSPLASIDSAYGAELALLRAAADDQLAVLDSSTVAVVRRNLDIIDAAIAESRAALAQDPASALLLEQLDRAYERKVDLLRRLVLL